MWYIFALIILIIIIYLCIEWQISQSTKLFIYGWYGADPVYCEQANLDSMILFLNDDGCGYILIKANDDSILLNDSFSYLLTEKYPTLSLASPKKYTIIFKGIDYQDFFPSTQTLEFLPITQRIKLYNEATETTHAILYKNNTVSDIM